MAFDPNEHPRRADGKFKDKPVGDVRMYATPNRTYGSKASCEEKFERFDEDMALYEPDGCENSVGVWDGDLERSRTYVFRQRDDADWADLKRDAQGLCDAYQQDSILLVRDNPDGESVKYTMPVFDVRSASLMFDDLAHDDPNRGREGYYGFGGTLREDGTVEIVAVDGDPTTTDNYNRARLWYSRHFGVPMPQEQPQRCDAALVFNSDAQAQRRGDEENRAMYEREGLIAKGGGMEHDPALSNVTANLEDWMPSRDRKSETPEQVAAVAVADSEPLRFDGTDPRARIVEEYAENQRLANQDSDDLLLNAMKGSEFKDYVRHGQLDEWAGEDPSRVEFMKSHMDMPDDGYVGFDDRRPFVMSHDEYMRRWWDRRGEWIGDEVDLHPDWRDGLSDWYSRRGGAE